MRRRGAPGGKTRPDPLIRGALKLEQLASQAEAGIKRRLQAPYFDADWHKRQAQAVPRPFSGHSLSLNHDGDVLEVRLHQPPCNEIGEALLSDLEELAAYLLSGAGGARALFVSSDLAEGFSAGADLRGLHAGLEQHAKQGNARWRQLRQLRRILARIHRVFHILDSAPMATVMAVHGPCFGGGFELALTGDMLVADKTARFCFPELRLGIMPCFGGIPRLKRELPNAVIRDLLLSGRSLRASRAHELGLVAQLVGEGKAAEVGRRLAQQAARFDPAAVSHSKRFTKPIPWEECEAEQDLFIQMVATGPLRDALRDFVNRTDPLPYLP